MLKALPATWGDTARDVQSTGDTARDVQSTGDTARDVQSTSKAAQSGVMQVWRTRSRVCRYKGASLAEAEAKWILKELLSMKNAGLFLGRIVDGPTEGGPTDDRRSEG